MPEQEKPKVKVGLMVSAKEFEALEFVERIHPGKYDGVASVLRDYSITAAVATQQEATAATAGAK